MATTTTARVAIITGSAQGIGLAIALRLAEDGYDIAINDLPFQTVAIEAAIKAINDRGRRAISIPADVTSEEDVKAMIDKTVKELGSLDLVSTPSFFVKIILTFFPQDDRKCWDLYFQSRRGLLYGGIRPHDVHQLPWSCPVFQICWDSDDQTRSWRQDFRWLFHLCFSKPR